MKLTPRNIVEELNKYIVGQEEAKKAVAVALSNRERRRRLDPEVRQEVMPKNIILIGPTGVGKTEVARRIASMVDAPFVKVEATKFTEVGYVGRDVDSIVAELVETCVAKTYDEKMREVESRAESLANERLVSYVCQQLGGADKSLGKRVASRRSRASKMAVAATGDGRQARPGPGKSKRTRQLVASLLKNRELDDQVIEIEVSDEPEAMQPYAEFSAAGELDDIRDELADLGGGGHQCPPQRRRRRVSVGEARRILTREEANKLIDYNNVIDRSLRAVEDNGVVFIDEIDKLVGPRVDMGRDVSGEGVQRDLLPLVEGSTVMTRYGPVKTDHVLFIAAGCFYHNKPSDLIPELQGRFPLRVELEPLSRDDLTAILVQPKNSLTRQYRALLSADGVELEFTQDGVAEIARLAELINQRSDNIGARRLNTIMERVLGDVSFAAPDMPGQKVTVDAAYVSAHVGDLVKDENLSRYIL